MPEYTLMRDHLGLNLLKNGSALQHSIPTGQVCPNPCNGTMLIAERCDDSSKMVTFDPSLKPPDGVTIIIGDDLYTPTTTLTAQQPIPVLWTTTACNVPDIVWLYTDIGFIDGGQDPNTLRSYTSPGDVPASPWSVSHDGNSLRLDWENDDNCASHNPHIQTATADASITIASATNLYITWTGIGEGELPNFEIMQLSITNSSGAVVFTGQAHAPGGGGGCFSENSVVSDPNPPQSVRLISGDYSLHIDASTVDPYYHVNAWYRFQLSFADTLQGESCENPGTFVAYQPTTKPADGVTFEFPKGSGHKYHATEEVSNDPAVLVTWFSSHCAPLQLARRCVSGCYPEGFPLALQAQIPATVAYDPTLLGDIEPSDAHMEVQFNMETGTAPFMIQWCIIVPYLCTIETAIADDFEATTLVPTDCSNLGDYACGWVCGHGPHDPPIGGATCEWCCEFGTDPSGRCGSGECIHCICCLSAPM